MGVTITLNRESVRARIENGKNNMIAKVAELALADCNEYVRVDQGTLRQSSYTASDFEKGELVWNTPYAQRVYYTGTPAKLPNPNAALQWCEVAHNNHSDDWNTLAQKEFTGGMK